MNTNLEKPSGTKLLRTLLRRRPLQIVAAVVAVMIASVVTYAIFGGEDEGSASATFAVRRGPLTISVTEAGTINNRDQVVVKSEVEGRTAILWLIPEGTDVKKGDLLVELDASRLQDEKTQQEITVLNAEASYIRARENQAVTKSQGESDVAEAELARKFAKLDLKKYIEGEYPQQVQQAEADITLAEEDFERLKDTLVWSKRLAKEGYITQTEVKADELKLNSSKIKWDLAKSTLDLLQKFTHERDLEQLRSDVEQAGKALERTRRRASADDVQTAAELRAKESEYARQKTQLAKTLTQIEKCKITAPVAGMVVYATTGRGSWRGNAEPLEEGQELRERQEIIHLPTTTSMMAEVKVHESSLRKVSRGMPVRITVDALPGKLFFGRVGKIGLLPDAQSAWLNPDLKVYSTEILLDGSDGELRPGMTCQAEIIVQEYPEALYVPVQSIVRVGGKSVVYVRGPDGREQRNVEVGLDNNRMARIVSGLSEGEEVLLAPPLAPSEISLERPAPPQGRPGPQAAASPGTAARPAPPEATTQPTTRPALDMTRLRTMSPEERRKFFENLTPEQRQEMTRRRGRRGEMGRGEGRGRGEGGRRERRRQGQQR